MKNKIVFILLILSSFAFNLLAQRPTEINQADDKGKKFGYWEARYPSGKIRYTGQFHNDKPIGEFRYYFESGALRATNSFSNNGLKANHKSYAENGILIAEGIYFDQKKDSTWKIYSDVDRVLIAEENYRNNLLHGLSTTFFPDSGLPAEILEYVDGKRHGEWKKFFDDGLLMSEGFYENDLLHGQVIFYYPNGKVQIRGNYNNGLKTGVWQTFDEDGNLLNEDVHKEGEF
ncbi:MAG: toxin-antitoxin system YwqK family antitoxin [Bacteroidales bacterium]|nr:toxin-antitoxin system YwqK family antitoxin [Bacteroidales bacterium]